MKQSTFSTWLKVIILGMAFCGLLIYGWAFPELGRSFAQAYPEFSYCYYPWLILLWLTGVPCFLVLAFAWKIAHNIKLERCFIFENGRLFQRIGLMAAVDSIFFFVMNILYLFLNLNHPAVLLLSCFIVFGGAAVAVVCMGLSRLVNNGAALQEQCDGTI